MIVDTMYTIGKRSQPAGGSGRQNTSVDSTGPRTTLIDIALGLPNFIEISFWALICSFNFGLPYTPVPLDCGPVK